MKWFIYLFSIVWIASGGFLILYTEQYRELMRKVFERMGRVPMAATAVIIGILLVKEVVQIQMHRILLLMIPTKYWKNQ